MSAEQRAARIADAVHAGTVAGEHIVLDRWADGRPEPRGLPALVVRTAPKRGGKLVACPVCEEPQPGMDALGEHLRVHDHADPPPAKPQPVWAFGKIMWPGDVYWDTATLIVPVALPFTLAVRVQIQEERAALLRGSIKNMGVPPGVGPVVFEGDPRFTWSHAELRVEQDWSTEVAR